jgi:hypothetical protein
MLSPERTREIVTRTIEHDEQLGEQAGGSGHLAEVSYEIDEIAAPVEVVDEGRTLFEIAYAYTLITVTEFTIYPDNPPHESSYRKSIVVDEEGTIVEESAREAAKTDRPWSAPDVDGRFPLDPPGGGVE